MANHNKTLHTLIVYTPYAELYHYEFFRQGHEDMSEQQARFAAKIDLMQRKWKQTLAEGDPYDKPHLTRDQD